MEETGRSKVTSVGFQHQAVLLQACPCFAPPALGVRGRGSYLIHYHCWLAVLKPALLHHLKQLSSGSSVMKMLLVISNHSDYRALEV